MRLLTHNSLISICKDSTKQVPLLLFIEDMEVEEREYDDEFMKNMLPSLCWDALKIAAKAIGMEDMPERYHPSLIQDEDFLRAIFNLLVNVHVVKGNKFLI